MEKQSRPFPSPFWTPGLLEDSKCGASYLSVNDLTRRLKINVPGQHETNSKRRPEWSQIICWNLRADTNLFEDGSWYYPRVGHISQARRFHQNCFPVLSQHLLFWNFLPVLWVLQYSLSASSKEQVHKALGVELQAQFGAWINPDWGWSK